MSVKVSQNLINDTLESKGTKAPLLLLVAALTMTGCASNPDEDGSGIGLEDAAALETNQGAQYGFEDDSELASSEVDQAAFDPDMNLRQTTVFYFDYDLSDLKPDTFEPLKAHARYLVNNPGVTVRLEGHCDERGTREYNIALGERRAGAIAKFLKIQGVSAGQIETVSYGEERPASYGHDNQAWSKNRRVELYY